MNLTPEEQEMLAGKRGHALKKSMEILVALGKIFGAEHMIPVKSAQISGVSYDNLGDAGLEFLEELAQDGKVAVLTTLNPAGMDMRNWKALNIPNEFAQKQQQVVTAFARMGVQTTCSCTPYMIGNEPDAGDHVAWGESSAVTFANSVLGARTNKEGGPSSIAAALTGVTPAYGLHLDKNRKAQVLVNVPQIQGPVDFGVLGALLGERTKTAIPLIRGIAKAGTDELKALAAALPTYGGPALFHIDGITPGKQIPPKNVVVFNRDDFVAMKKKLTDPGSVDFVLIGCPHASLEEIKQIATLLEGKTVTKEFWIATARKTKEEADRLGLVKPIEDAGATVVADTCHVVAPIKGRYKVMATNSVKGVFYGRSRNDFKTVLCSLEDCVRSALV